MAEKKNKKLNIIIDVILIVVFGLTSILSFVFFASNKKQTKVGYADNGKLDYTVHLKDNDFFENNVMESGSTYVSSLIDYIDIDYDYNMKYSEKLDGEYTYKVIATLYANKVNESSSNYFQKEYKLDEKTESIEDEDSFIFKDDIEINYHDYIEVLNEFKKAAKISVDGILKIDLIVESESEFNGIKNPTVKVNSIYSLSIPLTESSVNIEIKESGDSNKGTVNFGSESNITSTHVTFMIISTISTFLFAIMIIVLIDRLVRNNSRKSPYEKKLDKIMNSYNSIIVNVKEADDLSDYKIITLDSFEELLDAHSEVRMPINLLKNEEKQEATFVLLAKHIAWVYKLK